MFDNTAAPLHTILESLLPSLDLRIAILGIGNELNGDDAAGVLAVRGLRMALDASGGSYTDRVLIIEAGPSPESFGGPLRRFRPELVLFVDAAELNEPPGSVAWVDWAGAQGMSASTHTMPPTLFARYLVEEIGCRVILVGIQPVHLDFDRPVSPEVRAAVDALVGELAEKLLPGHTKNER